MKAENSETTSDANTKDINDIFEDILFSEDDLIKKSYDHGFEIGASQSNIEGYHVGYHRGAELGAEIGYYTGFIESYLPNIKEDKHIQNILKLKELLDSFPRTNVLEVDILELIKKIRTNYKKVCAQIKVHARFPEVSKVNF